MAYEKRFCVRIMAGKMRCATHAVYHRLDLPFFMVEKWNWYFEYRAALYRVQNPRHYCRLEVNAYDYIPPIDEQKKILKDKIKSKKGLITKWENNIALARKHWNQLFPIEVEEDYKKALMRVSKYKFELSALENEYKIFHEAH